MRHFLGLHGLTGGWKVSSSGVWAIEGLSATESAVRVMSEHGIDISEHRSRPLSAWRPPEGSLALGMTRDHVSRMKTLLPNRGSVVCLLGEASRRFDSEEAPEVPDPFGFGLSRYREVAAILRGMILDLARTLGSS